MASANILAALGAALQGGARTFGVLNEQENDNKRQGAYLEMAQRNQKAQEEDRQRKIILDAIEGADPNVELSPELVGKAKQFGLDTHLQTRQVGQPEFKLQHSQIPLGESVDSLANPAAHQGSFRLQSPVEKMKDTQANFFNSIMDPNDSSMGLSPEQKKRLGLAMQSGITGSELNSIVGPTGGTPNMDALVDKILKDPTVYAGLGKPLQEKLAPALAAKGFDFKAPAPPNAYVDERNQRVLDSVQELEDQASGWNTGWGSYLSALPATDARNFAGKLNTLKSNIMMNELTEMRAASKTGGALGQVSDTEGKLLAASLGNLDQAQSEDQIKAELEKIKGAIGRWEEAKAKAAAVQAPDEAPEPEGDIPQMTSGFRPAPPSKAPVAQAAAPAAAPQPGVLPKSNFTLADAQKAQAPQPQGDDTVTVAELNAMARDMRMSPKALAAKLQTEGVRIIGR